MQAIFEGAFDALYLTTVIALGIVLFMHRRVDRQCALLAAMAFVLGFGDAFHLVPRVVALATSGLRDYAAALGAGKLLTSVTMTAFYLILYYVWRARYKISGKGGLTAGMYALAALRVALCLMPQNRWLSAEAPLSWGIYRNIPFLLMGLVIIALFYKSARDNKDAEFKYMWLTIALSFAFYIPVVLFADAFPLVGMLMVPKTCAYVWTVLTGYMSMRGRIAAAQGAPRA